MVLVIHYWNNNLNLIFIIKIIDQFGTLVSGPIFDIENEKNSNLILNSIIKIKLESIFGCWLFFGGVDKTNSEIFIFPNKSGITIIDKISIFGKNNFTCDLNFKFNFNNSKEISKICSIKILGCSSNYEKVKLNPNQNFPDTCERKIFLSFFFKI